MNRKSRIFLSVIFIFTCVSWASAESTWKNNIPPRFQWDNNKGYCGEVCLISSNLYFGGYLSQYDMRSIALKGQPQPSGELLLGINDAYAASQIHLNCITYDNVNGDTTAFLAWVKQNVVKGYPVAIGIYTNEYIFYNKTNPDAGDDEYDHIVPVIGISSNHPLDDPNYYPDDVIYFSDNGLFGDPTNPPYYFSYTFGAFQANREQANAQDGSTYSLSDETANYGIVLTGVVDLNNETLPVRVDTNVNDEFPQIDDKSNTRPAPMPLTLTITVSNLVPGTSYILYRYNDMTLVPSSDFNVHAANAYEKWPIQINSGTTYSFTETILSDEIAVYRAVKAN